VPILWCEAADGLPKANPWRLSFSRLFDMANDSHHFRTAKELEADGYRREGNVFVSPYDRYLPLYEAKMLHQFDHRWATYEERESRRTGEWETEARDVTPQDKSNSALVVQPRYWVREEVVESTIPKYPEALATALQVEHRPSIQYVLTLWAAGFHLQHSDKEQAAKLLHAALPSDLDRAVARAIGAGTDEYHANRLAQDFPLTEDNVQAIAAQLNAPEPLARDLVERFSPKWFLGWRDITNSTNERTTISAALPKSAVGDTFLLMFSQSAKVQFKLGLIANLNSFIQDYGARQKVGGTHMKYNVFRQLAVLPPSVHNGSPAWNATMSLVDWLSPRVLELAYTSHDLMPPSPRPRLRRTAVSVGRGTAL
jgi:hypothetical protein